MTASAGPPAEPRETTIAIAVRSTDMDADRTVNNAVFFQYFEQARLEHLLRHGVIDWPPRREGGPPQFAIARTEAQFRAPAVHRDVLHATTRTVAVGTRSFTLAYELRRDRDRALVCEGSSVQVWLDAAGRSAPLPAEARAALERSLDTAASEG